MSIKLQQIHNARQQIGEAWSKLEEARQTLEELGVHTELQTQQSKLYSLAMRLADGDSCEGENVGDEEKIARANAKLTKAA